MSWEWTESTTEYYRRRNRIVAIRDKIMLLQREQIRHFGSSDRDKYIRASKDLDLAWEELRLIERECCSAETDRAGSNEK